MRRAGGSELLCLLSCSIGVARHLFFAGQLNSSDEPCHVAVSGGRLRIKGLLCDSLRLEVEDLGVVQGEFQVRG